MTFFSIMHFVALFPVPFFPTLVCTYSPEGGGDDDVDDVGVRRLLQPCALPGKTPLNVHTLPPCGIR